MVSKIAEMTFDSGNFVVVLHNLNCFILWDYIVKSTMQDFLHSKNKIIILK